MTRSADRPPSVWVGQGFLQSKSWTTNASGFLAEMSAGTLAEAEIVQRVGAYAGNATGRQLHELAKAAHIYSQDGAGPVRSAVGALLGNV